MVIFEILELKYLIYSAAVALSKFFKKTIISFKFSESKLEKGGLNEKSLPKTYWKFEIHGVKQNGLETMLWLNSVTGKKDLLEFQMKLKVVFTY